MSLSCQLIQKIVNYTLFIDTFKPSMIISLLTYICRQYVLVLTFLTVNYHDIINVFSR